MASEVQEMYARLLTMPSYAAALRLFAEYVHVR
jgi:hypothetical protein